MTSRYEIRLIHRILRHITLLYIGFRFSIPPQQQKAQKQKKRKRGANQS